MKIQLDTTRKTIKLEEDVKLSSFMNLIKKLLPNNEWKEFTLETNTTIHHWSNPVVIEKWCPTPYKPVEPLYPWWGITTYSSGYVSGGMQKSLSSRQELQSGVYNVEVSDKLL